MHTRSSSAPPALGVVSTAGDNDKPDQVACAPRRLDNILCLDDFEAAARRHLPRPIFGYMAGAAERNRSLRANGAAFENFDFVPRVLVDISKRSQATTLLGHHYAAPFGIAPLGLRTCSRSSEQQSQESQVDELQAGVELSLAVLP